MISSLLVNGGNYLYNLILGRMLGPGFFSEAALMVTLLLILSFLGMTLQLTVTKFSAQLQAWEQESLVVTMNRLAIFIGGVLGIVVILLAPVLQEYFQTQNALMFRIFGLGIPIYFLLSISRGNAQGQFDLKKLSISYQSEMWGRLIVTALILLIIPFQPGILVSFGILVSLVLGFFPLSGGKIKLLKARSLETKVKRNIKVFLCITACYELTQILINNSDVLLVKRYFDAEQAGLYAALALIGRVVYFIAWMFVMLLLPEVVRAKKEGKATGSLLFKYVGYVGVLSMFIVLACAIFPNEIIKLLFGMEYIAMAGLLWQYALATALFAIANIFTYYFLSLEQYKPIWFSAVFGLLQVILIGLFHRDLEMVVQIQIFAMLALFASQLMYFRQSWLSN
ncbi:sugar isomerase [Robiginitalea sp. IMCC43444]|uniref:sugar isomerase n=1 Tax=Robiginitalea sp. IMCC43444 TaxID=3459121 RepID=UPI004042B0B1